MIKISSNWSVSCKSAGEVHNSHPDNAKADAADEELRDLADGQQESLTIYRQPLFAIYTAV